MTIGEEDEITSRLSGEEVKRVTLGDQSSF